MSDKRRGLGRGLGALIPSAPPGAARPVDVFFPGPAASPVARRSDVAGEGDPAEHEAHGPEPMSGPPPWQPPTDREGAASADRDGSQPDDRERDGSGPATPTDRDGSDPGDRADAPSAVGAADHDGRAGAPGDEARAGHDDTGDDPAAAQDGLLPVIGATFAELALEDIAPNTRQPRTVFDDDELAELVHSITEIGVLQPVVVRRSVVDGAAPYELVMGERRWRASRLAGRATVPAIIKDTADDDMLRDALLENLHRSQLNVLEEAAAYQQLLDDFGCSHEELATRLGRSRPQISNTLRLLKLPPHVARRVAAGVLSAGHARALLSLGDGAAMERLAQRIVAEGLSVRSVEEIVALGGDDAAAKPRMPRPGRRRPALDEYVAALQEHFDTRVQITLGQRRGKVTIEFATVDDLNRIIALMGASTLAPSAHD